MQSLQAALLVALLATAAAVPASLTAPGGRTGDEVPQFVIVSHDDAIKQDTYDLLRQLTDGKSNAAGCQVPITLFVKYVGTECPLLKALYDDGFEVADHTVNHKAAATQDYATLWSEIVGFRDEIETCEVPAEDVVGFRAPFLDTKPEVRQVLHDSGDFLYDSSLVEATDGDSLSPSYAQRVFPFDMATGIQIDSCNEFSNRQKCAPGEAYPGLWQIPLWQMTVLGGPYNLDPAEDQANPVYNVLVSNFDAAYAGNRAPMDLAFHTPYLQETPGAVDGIKNFIDYAASKPNVWFVTYHQLIAWMNNPVPASQLTPELLGCGVVGGRPGTIGDVVPGAAAASPSPAPAGPSPAETPAPAPAEAADIDA